jgi:enoyl-CoA hydratase
MQLAAICDFAGDSIWEKLMNFDDCGDLTFRRDGRVLTIFFNRPDTLNAVTAHMHRELGQVFFQAAADPESDVIVVTGAGKAFSAGGDYNWMRQSRCSRRVAG